jgi:hypothetical protein
MFRKVSSDLKYSMDLAAFQIIYFTVEVAEYPLGSIYIKTFSSHPGLSWVLRRSVMSNY